MAETAAAVEEAAQLRLTSSDIGAWFVTRETGPSHVHSVMFDPSGNFNVDSSPGFDTFFGIDLEQLLRVRQAQLRLSSDDKLPLRS